MHKAGQWALSLAAEPTHTCPKSVRFVFFYYHLIVPTYKRQCLSQGISIEIFYALAMSSMRTVCLFLVSWLHICSVFESPLVQMSPQKLFDGFPQLFQAGVVAVL